MADTISISLKEYSDIQDEFIFWLDRPVIRTAYHKGKRPLVYALDLVVDTSTSATLTDSTDPANLVKNFTTPEQVYARSSNALDTEKSFSVIGEKADGSFGLFTFATDDTDGTTPVDLGTWNFIAHVIGGDACAGNLILDDDGSSTTVYFTLTLGATQKLGILVVPTGYKAALLVSNAHLTAEPTAAATDGMKYAIGDLEGHLNQYHPFEVRTGLLPIAAHTQISITTAFLHAVIAMKLHAEIVLWEE